MSQPASNAVEYLARAILPGDPWSLAVAARDGIPAGLHSFAARHEHRGYAGCDEDGVWRAWTVQRRTVELRTKDTGPVRVAARALLEWALPYITAPVLAELEALIAERSAAVDAEHGDTQLWWRATYRPSQLTEHERARLADAHRRRVEAEEAMRATVTACLAAEDAPGIQLDLFTMG